MGRKKKVKIPVEVDYGKSGREMLIEMGLLSRNPGDNIHMPIRKSKEEYERDNPFKKKYVPLTQKEENEYSTILAQKMLKQFRWLPWMQSFIDEFGNPKIYTRQRSKRVKIKLDGPKRRTKIKL